MTDFAFPVLLASLVMTVTNFVKYVRSRDVNGIVTQLLVWVVGVATTVLAAHSDLIGRWVITGTNLALNRTDGATQLLIGLTIASVASQLREIQKAVDRFDTSAKPELLSGEKKPAEVTAFIALDTSVLDESDRRADRSHQRDDSGRQASADGRRAVVVGAHRRARGRPPGRTARGADPAPPVEPPADPPTDPPVDPPPVDPPVEPSLSALVDENGDALTDENDQVLTEGAADG
jgi:hypothetical protein